MIAAILLGAGKAALIAIALHIIIPNVRIAIDVIRGEGIQ